MRKMRFYFDYNASAPMLPSAQAIYKAQCEYVGNASSPHAFGRMRRRALDEARAVFSDFFSCSPRGVIFTASATEANNLALLGFVTSHLIVSAVEHDSVWNCAKEAKKRGHKVSVIGVDGAGRLDENELAHAVSEGALVSLMAANNETGVIWQMEQFAPLIHEAGAFLHVDGVQALGRVNADVFAAADMVSVSSHKIGGALGAGALILCSKNEDFLSKCAPVIHGGGQEYGLRGGTENVSAIASFGVALKACVTLPMRDELRDQFEHELRHFFGTRLHIWGETSRRLWNTSCFGIAGWRAEEAVLALDLEGFAVSSGSACSSGHIRTSRVMRAMGADEDKAREAIRVSFGAEHRAQDIQSLCAAIKKLAPLAIESTLAI